MGEHKHLAFYSHVIQNIFAAAPKHRIGWLGRQRIGVRTGMRRFV
ncbi:hypothetical protein AB4851_08170 [Burkholderia sp. 22PA0099]